MRESLFLQKNAQKWQQMEIDVRKPSVSADDLSQSFIEITDDLAYARTFYAQSSIVSYLNGIAALYHQKIYRNKKEARGRIIWFWQFELPYLFKQYQKQFITAILIFSIFLSIGIFSAIYDENFVRLILGDDYVNMTLNNIRSGDPFGVYKQESAFLMFIGIAVNNVKVAFLTFVSGILFSVGPILIVFKNAVMLGTFETFLYQNHLGNKIILVVFIHGTLEMWSIIVAAASGLILGNSILFPGTYSRIDSMLRGAKDGLKIVFGLLPIFLVAAFLEGFVTRYTEMPLALSCCILLASLIFIVWYFFVYPHIVFKKYCTTEKQDTSTNLFKWKTNRSN